MIKEKMCVCIGNDARCIYDDEEGRKCSLLHFTCIICLTTLFRKVDGWWEKRLSKHVYTSVVWKSLNIQYIMLCSLKIFSVDSGENLLIFLHIKINVSTCPIHFILPNYLCNYKLDSLIYFSH